MVHDRDQPGDRLDRIERIENTLQTLKAAAAVLGITGVVLLGFVTYVFNRTQEAESRATRARMIADEAKQVAEYTTRDLEAKKQEAIQDARVEIAESTEAQLDRLNLSLRPKIFQAFKAGASGTRILGEYPVCFLVDVTTYHATQACQCRLELTEGEWKLHLLATAGKGECQCQAACFEEAA